MARQSKALHHIENDFASTLQILTDFKKKLSIICIEQSVHGELVCGLISKIMLSISDYKMRFVQVLLMG